MLQRQQKPGASYNMYNGLQLQPYVSVCLSGNSNLSFSCYNWYTQSTTIRK